MRKLLLLLTLLILSLSTYAEDEMRLSYCRGIVAATGGQKIPSSTPSDVAIYIPGTMLKAYEGNSIKAIRVGLSSVNSIKSLKVWVRKTLDDANATEQDVDVKTLKKGWTSVELSTPYSIDNADDGVYIGYTIEQSTSASNISVTDQIHDNAFFLRLGADNAWEDIHALGAVSLEGVVRGTNIPQYDLGILSATYKLNGDGGTLSAEIRNGSLNDIEGFEVQLNVFGEEQPAVQLDNFVMSGDNTNISVPFTVPADADRSKGVTITITKLNGADDSAPQNNVLAATQNYQRRSIVEEFSTEDCVNCPRVSDYMYNVMDRDEFKGKVFAVVHHVGYGTDFLTRDGDDAYTWLYNNGGNTYAPALMSDRYPYFQGSSSGLPTPCYNPGSPDEIANVFRIRLSQDAAADLSLKAHYTANDEIEVTVTGERGRVFSALPVRITVYVTEDSIKARDQRGTDDLAHYYHQHSLRVANSTWGDIIDWDADNHFVYTTTLTINPSWRTEQMHVIAFINRYDENDPSQCSIENAASIDFGDVATGISNNYTAKQNVVKSYYDLSGRELRTPAKGVNIVRYSDGTVNKILVK